MARYVEPRAARHRVEVVDGAEQLRVPVRRNWAIAVFLGLWLVLWGVGGGMAIVELVRRFDPFLLLFVTFWAIAGLFVLGLMAMLIAAPARPASMPPRNT